MPSRHLLVLLILATAACGGDSGGPGGGSATASGTVRNATSSTPIAGATVTVGSKSSVTDATGSYQLTGLPAGSVSLASAKAGFTTLTETVVLTDGANTHDVAMVRESLFRSNGLAIYIAPEIEEVRGVILGLGGFDTRAYATNDPPNSAPPEVQEAMTLLRPVLLQVAATHHLAVAGSLVLSDGGEADQSILAGLAALSTLSGHPELALAPLLMFGVSSGAPEAAGFPVRQPTRTIGWGAAIGNLPRAGGITASRAIPGFIILGELDDQVDNDEWEAFFEEHRGQNALWALAVEPNVGHIPLTDNGRAALGAWMDAVMSVRLPATVPAGTQPVLNPLAESSGWLGDRSTHDVAPYGSYPGDPLLASWLPSQTAAAGWQALVAP